MFLLNFLPDWIIYILIVGGVIGLVASFILTKIPFISQYGSLIKPISTIVLLLGIWLHGGIANEKKWQERVAELEKKVAISEEKSKQANVKLDENIKNNIKESKNKTAATIKYIETEITKYNSSCIIPKEVIKAVNAAALNKEVK